MHTIGEYSLIKRIACSVIAFPLLNTRRLLLIFSDANRTRGLGERGGGGGSLYYFELPTVSSFEYSRYTT